LEKTKGTESLLVIIGTTADVSNRWWWFRYRPQARRRSHLSFHPSLLSNNMRPKETTAPFATLLLAVGSKKGGEVQSGTRFFAAKVLGDSLKLNESRM